MALSLAAIELTSPRRPIISRGPDRAAPSAGRAASAGESRAAPVVSFHCADRAESPRRRPLPAAWWASSRSTTHSYASGDSSTRYASILPSVGGKPLRSSVTRRRSVVLSASGALVQIGCPCPHRVRLSAAGAIVRPSRCNRAARKASIELRKLTAEGAVVGILPVMTWGLDG